MPFDAGSIIGKLGLDPSGFANGILTAKGIASLFPSVVTDFIANPMLGAAAAIKEAFKTIEDALGGNLLQIIQHVGDALDNMGDQAAAAGVSVKFLSQLSEAGREAGIGIAELSQSMDYLARNAALAAQGDQASAKMFRDIGISATDATGHIRPTEQLFLDVADAISKLHDPAMQVKSAMDLMSRSGAQMLPVFAGGAAGLKELMNASDRFGATVTQKQSDIGGAFDRLHSLWDDFIKGLQKDISLPALTALQNHLPQIQTIMLEVSQVVRTKIGQAFEFISSTVIPDVVAAFNFLKDHAQGVMVALGAVGGAILGPAVVGAFTLFGPLVIGVAGAVGGLAAAWASLAGAFAGASAVGNAKTIFASLGSEMHALWDWIGSKAVPMLQSGLTAAFQALNPLITALQPVLAGILGLAESIGGFIISSVLPLIGKSLIAAFALLEPVLIGVAKMIAGLMPLVRVLWEIVKSIAGFLAKDVTDKLGELTPVLKSIGGVIEWLSGKLGELFGWLARVIGKASDFIGLTNGAAATASSLGSGSPTSHGASGASGASAGSPGSQPHAGAPSITVKVALDPKQTSHEISKVLHPAIQKGVDQVKRQVAVNARTGHSRRGL